METFVLKVLFSIGGEIEDSARGPYDTERICQEALRPYLHTDMKTDFFMGRCMTFTEYQRYYSHLPLKKW